MSEQTFQGAFDLSAMKNRTYWNYLSCKVTLSSKTSIYSYDINDVIVSRYNLSVWWQSPWSCFLYNIVCCLDGVLTFSLRVTMSHYYSSHTYLSYTVTAGSKAMLMCLDLCMIGICFSLTDLPTRRPKLYLTNILITAEKTGSPEPSLTEWIFRCFS